MKDFEKYCPTSDMSTFTELADAIAYRRNKNRRQLANTIGYDYYAEIVGPKKPEIIKGYERYMELKNKYPVSLWSIASAIFKFISHNPIGGALDVGKILSEHIPKWREVDEIIINDPNLKLYWQALQDDGQIDYDRESGRFFLCVKLYLENIDTCW